MKIIVVKNYKEFSKLAANLIIDQVKKKPYSILGLATGETPLGMYKELVLAYKKKRVNFSRVKCFNLDEYWPIKKDDKNSYHYYMKKNFFSKVNVKKKNIYILDGEAKNPQEECKRFSKSLLRNPVDVQILGIGLNGHIGFDEPNSGLNSKTRLIKLSNLTIKRNTKFFKNKEIPRKALTIGISEIMKSKKIILLASGKSKKQIICKFLKSKPYKTLPASFIKKHSDSILIVDKDACSEA